MIHIDDVALSLGGQRILDGVDATVPEGSFVGLVGPNGAGKTTLLRAVNGVLEPDRGSVTVDGDEVHALSAAARGRRVATVPQETRLDFDFSVRDVVTMGRHPHRGRLGTAGEADRERVERAMERTRVADLADRPVTATSGGERQRVLLARALAQDAPVLLADEPTASLDINHQVRTLELIADLVAGGRTVVAAIHDLNLAAHYCEKLVLLAGGSVLAGGPPADVLTEDHLARAFDARAVVSRHPVTGSVYVTALPDAAPDGGEGRVHVVGGGGSVSRLLYVLSAAGYDLSVGALNEGDADLEAARLLGVEAVTAEPFAPVDPAAEESVAKHVRAADATVVADVEVGRGNLPNLRAAREADALVVVEERPFEERNYAGSEARAVYESLRDRGVVVSPDEAVAAVADAVAAAATV